jgi:tetratricopeptide (TPR) repeat protein
MMVREPQNGSQRWFPARRTFRAGFCAVVLLPISLLTVANAEDAAEDARSGTAQTASPVEEAAPAPADARAASPSESAGSPAEVMGPTEGERELSLANYFITAGELTQDEDERRASYAKALEHAERAVQLLPNDAEAHFLVFGSEGRLAQMDGLATAALKLAALNRQLDEVLRLDPNHANALAARGGMMMKLPRLLGGDSEEGLAYLERAVSLDDESVGKRLELAEAYHMLGREQDAQRVANEALAAAEKRENPGEVANCKRFIEELAEACPGCALASVGR